MYSEQPEGKGTRGEASRLTLAALKASEIELQVKVPEEVLTITECPQLRNRKQAGGGRLMP